MSDRQTLAERGTEIALAGLAMAGIIVPGGAALVPLSVLWAWRRDQRELTAQFEARFADIRCATHGTKISNL